MRIFGIAIGKRSVQQKHEEKMAKIEAKKEVKIARIEGKTDRVEARQEGRTNRTQSRTDRVQLRQDGKTERTGIRQDNKTQRSTNRQATRAIAYQNGIDPNAAMWNGISSIARSASQFGMGAMAGGAPFVSALGGDNSSFFGTTGSPKEGGEGEDNNLLLYLGLGFLAMLLLKRS